MWPGLVDLPVIILLFLLAREDFKGREVSAWIFPVLGALWITRACITRGITFFMTDFPCNALLVFLFIGIIQLYGYFSQKRVTALVGKGDLYFMGLLSTSSLFPDLLLFINVSLCAALLWWVFTRSKRGIPLVGVQAACFIFFTIISWIRYHYT
jgi:membrane associated rhomboid family serine protease